MEKLYQIKAVLTEKQRNFDFSKPPPMHGFGDTSKERLGRFPVLAKSDSQAMQIARSIAKTGSYNIDLTIVSCESSDGVGEAEIFDQISAIRDHRLKVNARQWYETHLKNIERAKAKAETK